MSNIASVEAAAEVVEVDQPAEVVASSGKTSRRVARVVKAAQSSKSTDDASRPADAKAKKAEKTPTTKTAVGLTADSLRRLAVTALAEGKTNSEVVEELIQKHLRRHVLYTRPVDSDDQATPVTSAAA